MKEKSKASPIIGFTDTETVKLDFDQMTFSSVKYWAFRVVKHFKLGGFVILKSSKKCYHVVFDRVVSWSENMCIVAWVAVLSHSSGLQRYSLMQCIKQGSTLRMSAKKEKSSPRIVFRHGKQDLNVKDFLKYRQIVKKISAKLCEKHDF